MKRIFSILFALVLALAVAIVPGTATPVAADGGSTVLVDNLQPSWTAAGGGGVWSSYQGPPDYPYVSPGTTAVYDGREAAPIYAGVTIDPVDLIYEDQGLLAFKPGDVPISTFAAQTLTYDFENQYGTAPVWVYIELNKNQPGDIMYQYVPTSNPLSWHTEDAGTGTHWQAWTDLVSGIPTGPMLSLADIAALNSSKTVSRVYLTEGMGDSYHATDHGTVAWVDKVTIGTVTYDFVVPTYWYVAKTGSDTNEGTLASPFLTIQHAVGAAASGDTIHVAAGTYAEVSQTIIDKNLSIIGANKDTTIIKRNTGFTGNYFFRVNSGEFNLSEVTLDGEGNLYGGVRYAADTSTGTIDDNIIKNMVAPSYTGFGVVAYGDDVTVSNNIFTNIGRVGVWMGGDNGLVTGNTYTGKGAIDCLDYGIEVGMGGVATITANTITNCLGVASSDGSTSAAILVTTYYGEGTTATITCNTLTGNTGGIGVGYDDEDTSTVIAHYNNINGNTDYGVDTTAPTVDARYNWWGDASGPGGVGPGTGDSVSDNVLFYPWVHQEVVACNPGYLLDHFKVYLASGAPLDLPVLLQDQFHTEPFAAMVGSPVFFGNPADKLHDDVLTEIWNENDHLTVYNLTPLGVESQTWDVEVYNQFGSQNFTVSDPVMLAVPTRKAPHGPFAGPDHYLLYQVLDAEPFEVSVFLEDQFKGEGVMVLKPVYFANPVSKDSGPIVDPQAHLVFYQIVGAPYAGEVWIENQFGMAILGVSDPSLLAVPSDKVSFAATIRPDYIGIYRPSTSQFALDMDGNGLWNWSFDRCTIYGYVNDTPLIGDWNGDGKDEIGIYRPSTRQFALDMDGDGLWNWSFDRCTTYGYVNDTPLIGDWNGDGKDEIGIYRPSTRQFALDMDGDGLWNWSFDRCTTYGYVNDTPLIGDWNGDGKDEIGIYRPSTRQFALDMDGDGLWNWSFDRCTTYGYAGDVPIIGRW